MIRALPILVILGFCVALADDGQLARIRKLGERMLESPQGGGDSAYCELASILDQGGCLASGRIEHRIRISRKGLVETWVHQPSPGSGEPILYARGRILEKQWKDMLRAIAAMRTEPLPPGMPMPLPPESAMPIPVLTLSHGKDWAEYRQTGPSPGSIGDAFAMLDILARNATDTVWQLSLANPKAEVRKDSLHVTAEWKWRGPAGARILFSSPAEGDLCGTAAFKWFLDTSEFTVDWRRATASPAKGRAMVWDLPGKAGTVRLAFPYDGPKGKPKAKRVGMLEGIGIRLVPGGAKDTVLATVATDRFDF